MHCSSVFSSLMSRMATPCSRQAATRRHGTVKGGRPPPCPPTLYRAWPPPAAGRQPQTAWHGEGRTPAPPPAPSCWTGEGAEGVRAQSRGPGGGAAGAVRDAGGQLLGSCAARGGGGGSPPPQQAAMADPSKGRATGVGRWLAAPVPDAATWAPGCVAGASLVCCSRWAAWGAMRPARATHPSVAVVHREHQLLEKPARHGLPQPPLLLHKVEQAAAIGVIHHCGAGGVLWGQVV